MSCVANCDTVQIIEPKDEFLVDTAGTRSDMDERGELELHEGQVNAIVYFEVKKLNATYNFEYLYVDAMGDNHPGAVQVVPTIRAVEGFAVAFAGAPLNDLCVLHWRVTIVRTSSLVQIDAPEDLYLQIPINSGTMTIPFTNPRSGTSYGFSELRVENLTENPGFQSPIHVQVYAKTLSGFSIGISPRPRSNFYFLKVRTP
jgi:hypothetical protein